MQKAAGALALLAAAVAVTWANLDAGGYHAFQHHRLGPLDVEAWAADGALTLFFFLAGLELKRELVTGSLRRPRDAAVPVVAALAGVAVPALIYLAVNLLGDGEPVGWAVPAATDIAFALAVLAVVGRALPPAVRAFLLTLAVVDDLVVIVIIAVAYTDALDAAALGGAVLALAAYGVCWRRGWSTPVLLVPLALSSWWLMHESGVHATVAGVLLGLLTPVTSSVDQLLEPVSNLFAVPFFALLSAGVVLAGGGTLTDPVVIGVVAGLVLGKPVGILAGALLTARLTGAGLGRDVGRGDLLGAALLGGIGFTVSLLVADLSFDGSQADRAKTAVLAGSLIATTLGTAVLLRRNRHHRRAGTVGFPTDRIREGNLDG